MSVSPSGFALRHNGSCEANEVDCGPTVSPYHACCPADSFCPTQYNVNCCPSSANCTESLIKNPQCANQTWDLYDNGGYFCCERGFTGYASTREGSDGCASPGYEFKNGQVLLPLISTGQVIELSSTSTSAPSTTIQSSSSITAGSVTPTSPSANSSSSSATATPTTAATDRSKTPTGPIIGGVIGGVGCVVIAAVAFWIWRKRRRPTMAELEQPLPRHETTHEKYSIAIPNEMEGHHTFYGNNAKPSQLAGHHGVSELAN